MFKGGFSPPTNISQTILRLRYRPAKLYMGCAKKSNKPDLSRQWFVYYSHRNKAGKMVRQKPIYKDINTFSTIAERKEYGKNVIDVINDLLRSGFSPYDGKFKDKDGALDKNILNCAELYLSEKKKSLAVKSYRPYSQHVGWFIDWIKENRLTHLDIDEVKRSHITQFLSDYRGLSEKEALKESRKPASNRQINNIKANINTFFNYFVVNFEDEVSKNPAKGVKDLPHLTQGNKAYTDAQIKLLKELMTEHNPSMLMFCEMVYESCTRPHEETRLLKVSDIEFNMNRIHIRPELSKEGRSEYIPMSARYMETLRPYVEGFKADDYLFTINSHPGKKDVVGRFTPGEKPIAQDTLQAWYRKIKGLAGLDGTWSIYSWAHSYCVRAYLDTKDIFFIQIKKRHTTMDVTCKYLRDLGLFVDLNGIADNVRGI